MIQEVLNEAKITRKKIKEKIAIFNTSEQSSAFNHEYGS
jgi:hypothetical protein